MPLGAHRRHIHREKMMKRSQIGNLEGFFVNNEDEILDQKTLYPVEHALSSLAQPDHARSQAVVTLFRFITFQELR